MNTPKHKRLNVIVTGLLVLVITLTALFWIRWFTESTRLSHLGKPELMIRPSGLLPWETHVDPNDRFACSAIVGDLRPNRVPDVSLGPVAYWRSRQPEGPDSPVYLWDPKPDGTRLYYDRSLGLIVYRATETVTLADGSRGRKQVVRYMGAYAVTEEPLAEIRRFRTRPMLVCTRGPWVFYDPQARSFHAISNWRDGRTVRTGIISPDDRDCPIQFMDLRKEGQCLGLSFQAPKLGRSSMDAELEKLYPGRVVSGDESEPALRVGAIWDQVLVLDASGAIERLNLDTLQIDRQLLGWLPSPETLFSSSKGNVRTNPFDVLAYKVIAIGVEAKQPPRDSRYLGCAAATVSRDGTAMEVRVFDPNGRAIASTSAGFGNYQFNERRGSFYRRGYVTSTPAAYSSLPDAAPLTALKVLTESLHPPVLLLASFFTARHVEATAGWRALFLSPNSLVAMRAQTSGLGLSECFLLAIPLLLPSLVVVAGLFAILVSRDGRRMGLSRLERKLWIAGVFAFGLPAYVTYRLTRPKGVLVTCANCGARRRPDMERCHYCNSRWEVPELNPPAWRVLDGGRCEMAVPVALTEPEPGTPAEEAPAASVEEEPPVE